MKRLALKKPIAVSTLNGQFVFHVMHDEVSDPTLMQEKCVVSACAKYTLRIKKPDSFSIATSSKLAITNIEAQYRMSFLFSISVEYQIIRYHSNRL
jgi:hypothetical protein